MITEKALPSRGKLAQKLQDLYVRIQFVISIIKVNFKRIYPHTPELIKDDCFFFSCYVQCRSIPIFSRRHDTIFSQMRHIPFVFQFTLHYFCSPLSPFLSCPRVHLDVCAKTSHSSFFRYMKISSFSFLKFPKSAVSRVDILYIHTSKVTECICNRSHSCERVLNGTCVIIFWFDEERNTNRALLVL